jgi:hypothetical protein
VSGFTQCPEAATYRHDGNVYHIGIYVSSNR